MDYNKTIITGRLTADPELKTTTTGKSVCSFTVAVNGKDKTEFINAVSWDAQAEFVSSRAHKGSLVLVDGRIATRTWEGKDGGKRITTEIIAEKVNLLGGKEERRDPDIMPDTNDANLFPAEGSDIDGDLPF